MKILDSKQNHMLTGLFNLFYLYIAKYLIKLAGKMHGYK